MKNTRGPGILMTFQLTHHPAPGDRRNVARPGPQSPYAIRLNETPGAELTHVRLSDTMPFAQVQRARILLLAHRHPAWTNRRIAPPIGCCLETVKVWRQRWQGAATRTDRPRAGASRVFPAVVRAPMVALACPTPPAQGNVWKRWRGEKLAAVAMEQGLVTALAPRPIRRWWREDQINPWRSQAWQKSAAPQCVEQAGPVLERYEQAQERAQQGDALVCVDEKTSIHARQRRSAPKAAVPPAPMPGADRYRRMGAVNLFCALRVATGMTGAQGFLQRCFADVKTFLLAVFANAACQGVKVRPLMLDKGSTHAPRPLAAWIESRNLSGEVRISGLPPYARWLDQVEIIFRKVQRDVLTPHDFPSTTALRRDLMDYCAELNQPPTPVKWTYTQVKWLATFGTPPPNQRAAYLWRLVLSAYPSRGSEVLIEATLGAYWDRFLALTAYRLPGRADRDSLPFH
jgi:DDE superfamily endonuclease